MTELPSQQGALETAPPSPPGSEANQDTTSSSERDLRTLIQKKKSMSTSTSASSDGSPADVGSGGTQDSKTKKKKIKRLQQYTGNTNTSYSEPFLKRARLFVGNVQPNLISRMDLVNLFSKYGDVLGVSVHNGYAFIQMDQEKSANMAINYTDNRFVKGSRIDVEFSEAARMAGAKFKKLNLSPFGSLPAFYTLNEEEMLREKEHELRIARILQMEREIAMLRSKQVGNADNQRGAVPVHHYSDYGGCEDQVLPQYPSPQARISSHGWTENHWRPSHNPSCYSYEREHMGKVYSPPNSRGIEHPVPHPSRPPPPYHADHSSRRDKEPVHFTSPPLQSVSDPYGRWHRESPRHLHYDGEGPLVQVFLPSQP